MKFLNHKNNDKKIPIKVLFILPFVLLIIVITAIWSYLFVKNGQQSAKDAINTTLVEINNNIKEHLYSLLELPHTINQLNADTIEQGLLDTNNPDILQHYL